MAFSANLASLFVNIVVNSSRASAGIQKIQQDLNRTTQQVQQMHLSFVKVKAAAAIFYLISNVIKGFEATIREAVITAGELERQFTKIRNAANLDSSGLERFKDQLVELVNKLEAVPFRDLQSISLAVAQAGITETNQMLQFTEAVAKAASVGEDISAGELAKFLLLTIDLYDKNTASAEHFAAVLHKLAQEFRTTEGEIVKVAEKIIGAGRNFGLTAEEVLALATALRSVAITAERASSFTAKLIQDLDIDPKKFERVLNLAPDFEVRKRENPAKAIIEVLDAIKSKGFDVGETLTKLDFDERRVFQTTQNLALGIDNFARALDSISDKGVNTKKFNADFSNAVEDAQTSVTKLSNAWTLMMSNFGKTRNISAAIEALTFLITTLDKFSTDVNTGFGIMFSGGLEADARRSGIPAGKPLPQFIPNIPDPVAIAASIASEKRRLREKSAEIVEKFDPTLKRFRQGAQGEKTLESELKDIEDEYSNAIKELSNNSSLLIGDFQNLEKELLALKTQTVDLTKTEYDLKAARKEEKALADLADFLATETQGKILAFQKKFTDIFNALTEIDPIAAKQILPQLQQALNQQLAGMENKQAEFSDLADVWKKAQIDVLKQQDGIPILQLKQLQELLKIDQKNLPEINKKLDNLVQPARAGA